MCVYNLSSIKTYGSSLLPKTLDFFCLYYENVNGLPVKISSLKYPCKYRRLHLILRKLNVNIVSLTETKVNAKILDITFNIPSKFFELDLNILIYSSNEHNLTGKRQQGGIITTLRGKNCKFVTSLGSNPTILGRFS